tara:strand:- start:228 stop:3419 length:3192 start_codon:yes stop_codon:yes gene_type:complete
MGQTVTTSSDKKDITIATWLNEVSKATNNDGTELEIQVASSGPNEEQVTLLSFTVGDLSTLGISASSAILRKVHVVLTRRSTPSGTNVAQMCFLTSDFTENQADWYGPHDDSSTTEVWEPAFDGASTTGSPAMLKGQVIDSQTTTGAGAVTFEISEHLINKEKITFGSTINLGLWATSGEAEFDHEGQTNKPQYYVTYEIPTPEGPEISITPNPDGITGTINVDKLSSSPSLNKYSLCWSKSHTTPDHTAGNDITDFEDTGLKEINTDQLGEISSDPALGIDDTAYYFRLYAEDGVNNDDNGGGSNVLKVIRPEVASSGTAISPSSLTIGEETTLTVVAETISGHPYGGKFSSVLVNWDYAASDTAADYVEYKFADNTAPALTTASNLTIKHKYHKNVSNNSSGNFGIKVKIRDPDGWVSDAYTVGNATVTSSSPIAHINANKGKVMNAKFVDKNNMLTISAAQSRAVGSDREIQNYLFTCHAGNADTIVTMGAYDNNNEVFDTGSKRVALRHLGTTGLQLGDTRLRIFGVASFNNNGTPENDHSADFAYYKYTSETIKPPDSVGSQFTEGTTAGASDTIGNYSYNYFKSVEGAVFIAEDAHDTTGERYILTAYSGDWTTKLSGVALTEDITVNEELLLSVDNVEVFKAGDVIKINNEYMKVCSTDSTNSRLYVSRGLVTAAGDGANAWGYLFSTTAAHSNGDAISILDPFIINRDLRYRTKTDVTDAERRYRWGGYAQVVGSSNGIAAQAFSDSGNGSGGFFEINQTEAPGASTVYGGGSSVSNGTLIRDWFANGFFEDDIIAVELTGGGENGGYASPKYFKIAAIRRGNEVGGKFDELMIYGSDVDDYISTTLSTVSDAGTIARVISNPTRTVAIYSPSVVTDEIVFETMVYDETYYSTGSLQAIHYRTDTAFTTVTSTIPNVLDLLTTTDYDLDSTTNALTSADIAILSANKSRSGGLSATMPLGADKYPVSVIRNKAGLPTMSVSLRILSSTGLRRIRSLIEGDTYDYVFLDSNQVDSPSTKEVTYRMKLSDGSLNKSPELGNEYLADLEFVIVGEDVS